MSRRPLLLFTLVVATTAAIASPAAAQNLLLYGGENHDVFLGCISCSSFASDSVWNAYGTYGNPYSSSSIWNRYGTYGSSYSSLSPWSAYATDPPVIVDRDGNFYGYFTANKYKAQRTRIEALVKLLDDPEWTFDNLDTIRESL